MTQKQSRDDITVHSLVDLAWGRLTPEQSLALFDELEGNPERSQTLELIIDVMAMAHTIPTIEGSREPFESKPKSEVREAKTAFTLVIRSAAVIVLLFGSFLFSGEFYKESQLGVARVRVNDLDVRTRGESNAICDIAYSLIEGGQEEQAGELIDWCLSAYTEGEEKARAHLLKGGLLLMRSGRQSLPGLPNYDTILVRRGLEELDVARQLTNRRQIEECALWLGLKAYLMLGDERNAKMHLEKVVEMGGIRQADAQRLQTALGW